MTARQGWLTWGLVGLGLLFLVGSIWTAPLKGLARKARVLHGHRLIAKRSGHRGP